MNLTSEQRAFLLKGTHRRISITEHVRARRWAQRREGRWIADQVLDWDGHLLPRSSMLYIGRIFVRPLEKVRGQWSRAVINNGFSKEKDAQT